MSLILTLNSSNSADTSNYQLHPYQLHQKIVKTTDMSAIGAFVGFTSGWLLRIATNSMLNSRTLAGMFTTSRRSLRFVTYRDNFSLLSPVPLFLEPWKHVLWASTGCYIGYSYDSHLESLNDRVNQERAKRGLEVRNRKSLTFGYVTW